MKTDIWLISLNDQGEAISPPTQIAHFSDYENQPVFLPGDSTIMYVKMGSDLQSDLFTYQVRTGNTSQWNYSKESEYSPNLAPGGNSFSVVRVEKDSTQRIWSLSKTKREEINLFPKLKGVGYYCWLSSTSVAAFIVGDTTSLVIADMKSGEVKRVDQNIGRGLRKVPEENAFCFVKNESESAQVIYKYDLNSGEMSAIVHCPEGYQDFDFTSDGTLWMAAGSKIFSFHPGKNFNWIQVIDLSEFGIKGLYRIACSNDGKTFALVNKLSD